MAHSRQVIKEKEYVQCQVVIMVINQVWKKTTKNVFFSLRHMQKFTYVQRNLVSENIPMKIL